MGAFAHTRERRDGGRGGRRIRADARKATVTSPERARVRRPGTLYRLAPRRRPAVYPDPASRFPAAGPRRAVRSRRSRPRTRGATRTGAASRATGRCSTSCTSARSRAKAPGRAAARELPSLAELGVTVIEVMPVAEFPGRSAGATTASTSSRRRASTARPTTCARSSTRPRARPRRDSRRRLQPLRADRQLPARVRPDVFQPTLRERLGRRAQLRRRRMPRPCASSSSPTRLLDRRVPPRRPAARRDAGDLRRARRRTSSRRSRGARAAAAGARRSIIVGENEPQDVRLARGRRARAATASTRCGTTTSTTARGSRSPGARGVLHRLPRHAAGARLGGEARLPVPGAALRLAEAAARHARPAALDAVARSSPSSRTTTRSRTRRAACACTQLTSPGRYRARDGAAPARAADADAVPGPGVRRVGAVPLLRRSRAGERGSGAARAAREFLGQFPSIAAGGHALADAIPRRARRSSAASSISRSARRHAHAVALHRDLLELRRGDPRFQHGSAQRAVDGAVLAHEAFVLRYFGDGGDDRLLIVNFGRELELSPVPEPLLAPPHERAWKLRVVERRPRVRRRRHATAGARRRVASAGARGARVRRATRRALSASLRSAATCDAR